MKKKENTLPNSLIPHGRSVSQNDSSGRHDGGEVTDLPSVTPSAGSARVHIEFEIGLVLPKRVPGHTAVWKAYGDSGVDILRDYLKNPLTR